MGDIMNTSKEKKIEIEFRQLKIINRILSDGDRVELIPVKDGVKVIRVRRSEEKN